MNTIRVSNNLEQNQALNFDGPDLGPNCLQMLSKDDIGQSRLQQMTNFATS